MTAPDFSALPEVLRARVERDWAECAAHAGELSPALAEVLPRIFGASAFVSDWCRRNADGLGALFAAGWPLLAADEVALDAEFEALDGEDFDAALRQLRNREMVRIAAREIAAVASPEQTVHALSDLADRCLRACHDHHWRALCTRHGPPRTEAGEPVTGAVLALGKLGGRELNFSSDVDVIFVYGAEGATGGARDGGQVRDNATFFQRLAQRVTASMSDRQAQGFVFRVDTRLRPFGNAGPMAVSLAAMEDYYTAHGRDWERYALIKARVVVGDEQMRGELASIIKPFVYRRYLDFGAIESLRAMKAQIDAQVRRSGHEEHIKLGWGGIREVEFLIQVFQLVRGGAEPRLQQNELMAAMDAVAALGLWPEPDIDSLRAGYWLLRRVENCWQAQADEQVHVLPTREEPRQALALAMGCTDWASFEALLQPQRAAIHAQFERLFAEPDSGPGEIVDAVRAWWGGDASALTVREDEKGALEAVHDAIRRRVGDDDDRQHILELIATLWTASHDRGALARILAILEALAGRAHYVALLAENPVARNALIDLCSRSEWLATELRRHPALLGELIDPVSLYAPDDREVLRHRLQRALANIDAGDDEQRLDELRRMRQAATLRIAAADLSAALPIMRVSDHLSHLAEEILRSALDIAFSMMRRRHPDIERPRLSIIAYGKLGGLELGYTSDLDLVFLYQPDAAPASIDAQVFYTRLTQKLIHCISTPTGAGVAYEVDTRLRPSGGAGLLVSTSDGLESYLRENAWTWEHQALIRARPVAGDEDIGARFEAIRQAILCQPRDRQALAEDVREMRAKMRRELAPADGAFDLKQSPGGITDIEFLVQFLVLAYASEFPQITRHTDVCRQLEALAGAACISNDDAEDLAETYRVLRSAAHREFLCGEIAAANPAVRDQVENAAGRIRAIEQAVASS